MNNFQDFITFYFLKQINKEKIDFCFWQTDSCQNNFFFEVMLSKQIKYQTYKPKVYFNLQIIDVAIKKKLTKLF